MQVKDLLEMHLISDRIILAYARMAGCLEGIMNDTDWLKRLPDQMEIEELKDCLSEVSLSYMEDDDAGEGDGDK